MKNMKISVLFKFAPFILCALYLAVVIAALWNTYNVQSGYSRAVNNSQQAVIELQSIQKQMHYGTSLTLQLLVLGSSEELVAKLSVVEPTLLEHVDRLNKIYADEPEVTSELMAAIEVTSLHFGNFNVAVASGDEALYNSILVDDFLPALNILSDTADRLQVVLTEASNIEIAQVNNIYTITQICIVIVSVLLLIMMLSMSSMMNTMIVKPIDEVQKAVVAYGEGNFDVDIKYQSTNELGVVCDTVRGAQVTAKAIVSDIVDVTTNLNNYNYNTSVTGKYPGQYAPIKDNINRLIDNQNALMQNIRQLADKVSESSEHVAMGAQTLAQGSTEQAASVQELLAAIKDISDQISMNATLSENALNISSEATTASQENQRQMQNLLIAMEELDNKSKEIGSINKTIEQISFQTNILALNASVEAASAGVAGRGFAIVAEEVRNLAARSADAASGTAELIEKSLEAVRNGVALAEVTAQNSNTVVAHVLDTTQILQKLSGDAVYQADALQEITKGLDQIAIVVQTNSATSEESAVASQELSSKSIDIMEVVDKFNLK